MYVFSVGNERYTFRIPGKNSEKFVDRGEEQQNINIIKPLGINNETIYFDIETGYKIARFVEGTPLSDVLDPEAHLEALSCVLHTLHESDLTAAKDYNPFGRLEEYEQLVKEHELKYGQLKEVLEGYRPFLEQTPTVFCHNDSQISNVVLNDEKIYLLDWEFAGQNDPLYDVACVGNKDFALAEACLPVYLKREPLAHEWKRLYLWRGFQCLQWHNVALYKDSIGLSAELGVDFKAVAHMYVQKAETFLTRATDF